MGVPGVGWRSGRRHTLDMTYSEKLKDPRWQRKRLEIMQRDGFKCCECGDTTKTLHVHHSNGYRNGLDPWEYADGELQTLCEPCHSSTHRSFKIYLAGRISKSCWRVPIVGDQQGRISLENTGILEFLTKRIFGQHDYTGPFFISCDHGCGHEEEREDCGHGEFCECGNNLGTSHGRTANGCTTTGEGSGRHRAARDAYLGIKACDLFFAWIYDQECFGTLVEVGIAAGMGKPIYIAHPQNFDPVDLWFAERFRQKLWIQYDNPSDALKAAIKSESKRRWPPPPLTRRADVA